MFMYYLPVASLGAWSTAARGRVKSRRVGFWRCPVGEWHRQNLTITPCQAFFSIHAGIQCITRSLLGPWLTG